MQSFFAPSTPLALWFFKDSAQVQSLYGVYTRGSRPFVLHGHGPQLCTATLNMLPKEAQGPYSSAAHRRSLRSRTPATTPRSESPSWSFGPGCLRPEAWLGVGEASGIAFGAACWGASFISITGHGRLGVMTNGHHVRNTLCMLQGGTYAMLLHQDSRAVRSLQTWHRPETVVHRNSQILPRI